MFNVTKLQELLVTYKYSFSKDIQLPSGNVCNHWYDEKYKWIGYKAFQDNWDIDASDFYYMTGKAFIEIDRSLNRGIERPLAGISKLAKADPECVRGLFSDLYNEKIDVITRYNTFMHNMTLLYENIMHKNVGIYKQSSHAVSVYLSLKYPEKYFIYTKSHINALAKYLECKWTCGNMPKVATYNFFSEFYHQVRIKLKQDEQLMSILQDHIDDTMYQDPKLTLLTTDLAYFVKHFINELELQDYI